MSTFFSKFTELAKQGSAQIISSVNKAKTAIASTAVNLAAASAIAAPVEKLPELSKLEEMEILFREVCEIIDHLAVAPDANTIDMDLKLNQTDIRVKLRRIVEILQQEGQIWLMNQRTIVNLGSSNDDLHVTDTPCLDHFIQMNMISELCNRAMSDSPRGILRLVLTTVSTMLRQITYPLLPHQSVYRPVAKLIFVASRYEAFIQHDSSPAMRKSAAEKEKLTAFHRRMEISLTSLLRTVWRKIIDNPPSLDYFIVADRRTSSVDQYVESSRGLPKMQIDVLSSLLPLVHNPKVGQYAQESILIALNIRDTRVDFYLAYNTGFTFSLVRNVCDDFNAALHFLQKQLTSNSNIIIPSHLIPFCATTSFTAPSNASSTIAKSNSHTHMNTLSSASKPLSGSTSRTNLSVSTPSSSSSSGTGGILGFFPAETPKDIGSRLAQEQAQRQQKKAQEEETYNAVTQFLNSLTFLRAVFHSLRGREQQKKSQTEEDDTDTSGVQHCLQRISDTFYAEFIQGCLHTALDSSNEVQNTVVYILLKLLLSHLAWTEDSDSDSTEMILRTNRRKLYDSRHRCPLTLLGETLNYLLYQPGGSMGSFKPSDHYRSVLDRSTSMSKSLSSSANMLQYVIISAVPPLLGLQLLTYVATGAAATSVNPLAQPVHQLQPLPFDSTMLTFEDALSRCCAAIDVELNKEKSMPPAAMVLSLSLAQMPRYVERSTHHLFRKLFHRGDDILRSMNNPDKTASSSSFDGLTASKSSALPDNMLFRALKRLHAFSSLRIDEQITLSGIVSELSCLLCVSMLLNQGKTAKDYLQQLYTLFRKVDHLRTELNVIVRQIPDVRKKIFLMKEHLQEEAFLYVMMTQDRVDASSHIPSHTPAASGMKAPGPSSSSSSSSAGSRRKLIENESMQQKQLMTSAIILQELAHEVLGYLYATKAVGRMLHDQQHFLWDNSLSTSDDTSSDATTAMDMFFGEALADTRRVDEEEFSADKEDLENYRQMLASLAPSTSVGNGGSLTSSSSTWLNLDQTEKDFMAELSAMEATIESMNNVPILSIS